MTSIQWTEQTWNPATGCDRVSEGCLNCYAMTMAKRLKGMGQAKYQTDGDPRTSGPGFGVAMHEDVLDEPFRWKKPRRVFVNSMSDLFHPRITDQFIAQVFATMALTPKHTYQILTKRHARMRSLLTGSAFEQTVYQEIYALDAYAALASAARITWPLPNVWMGVSIESDQFSRRADYLRDTSAAVRFISAEPLLGPLPTLDLSGIGWLIVGGESGPGARPLDVAWVNDLLSNASASGTAPFVKQLGSVWARDTYIGGQSVHAMGDTKGGTPEHWPAHLRIRAYPEDARKDTQPA